MTKPNEEESDVVQEAVLYGQIWNAVIRAEAEAVRIARKHLGDEAFFEHSQPFLNLSARAHDAVDALKAQFIASVDAPVPEREAFLEKYTTEMPQHLEDVYHGTLSLARALRDHIPADQRLHREAKKLVDSLEAMQPERAAEYRAMDKAARVTANAAKPDSGRKL